MSEYEKIQLKFNIIKVLLETGHSDGVAELANNIYKWVVINDDNTA